MDDLKKMLAELEGLGITVREDRRDSVAYVTERLRLARERRTDANPPTPSANVFAAVIRRDEEARKLMLQRVKNAWRKPIADATYRDGMVAEELRFAREQKERGQ